QLPGAHPQRAQDPRARPPHHHRRRQPGPRRDAQGHRHHRRHRGQHNRYPPGIHPRERGRAGQPEAVGAL
ncbi:hypothetical protein LTR28_002646, partial [Elasticomyces elasticus]